MVALWWWELSDICESIRAWWQVLHVGSPHRRAGLMVPEVRAVTHRWCWGTGSLMASLLGSVFSLWLVSLWCDVRCVLLTGTPPFSTPSCWWPFSPRTQRCHLSTCIVHWGTCGFKVSSSTGSSLLRCYLGFFLKPWVRVWCISWQSQCWEMEARGPRVQGHHEQELSLNCSSTNPETQSFFVSFFGVWWRSWHFHIFTFCLVWYRRSWIV